MLRGLSGGRLPCRQQQRGATRVSRGAGRAHFLVMPPMGFLSFSAPPTTLSMAVPEFLTGAKKSGQNRCLQLKYRTL